jgi:hypothetical protein
MESDYDFFIQASRQIEGDLGLPAGFVAGISTDDDWSFVIKAHALAEATITQLVLAALGRADLGSVLEATTLLGRSGKLSMARALDLLGPETHRFVERLAQLRKGLIHDVRRMTFEFDTHLGTLSVSERDALERALLFLIPIEQARKANPRFRLPDSVRQNLKLTVWLHLVAFLTMTNARRSAEERQRQIERLTAHVTHKPEVDRGRSSDE